MPYIAEFKNQAGSDNRTPTPAEIFGIAEYDDLPQIFKSFMRQPSEASNRGSGILREMALDVSKNTGFSGNQPSRGHARFVAEFMRILAQGLR